MIQLRNIEGLGKPSINGITTINTLTRCEYTRLLLCVQDLRDWSLYFANKYRHDVVLGEMHNKYLDRLNEILNEKY